MTVRTLTNSQTPFAFPDAERGSVVLQFTLVGPDQKSVIPVLSADDAPMGAVRLLVEDMVDGVFSVDLQTNDTTTPETFYLVDLWQTGLADGQRFYHQFISSVPSGPGELQWSGFFTPPPGLEPGEWTAFLAHAQGTEGMVPVTGHLSTDERAALDGANAPDAGNPLATLGDVIAGGGFVAYDHVQSVAAAVWTVNHNRGARPSVELLNAGGAEFDAEVIHTSVNQLVIHLNTPATGTARCL